MNPAFRWWCEDVPGNALAGAGYRRAIRARHCLMISTDDTESRILPKAYHWLTAVLPLSYHCLTTVLPLSYHCLTNGGSSLVLEMAISGHFRPHPPTKVINTPYFTMPHYCAMLSHFSSAALSPHPFQLCHVGTHHTSQPSAFGLQAAFGQPGPPVTTGLDTKRFGLRPLGGRPRPAREPLRILTVSTPYPHRR